MNLRHGFLAAGVAVAALAPAALALAGTSPASAAAIAPATQSHAAPAHVGTIQPDSASGCAGDSVCIEVAGSGLRVDSVGGGVATPGGAGDVHTWCGYVWVTGTLNGQTYLNLNSVSSCANPFKPYSVSWTLNEDFPNGTKICLGQYTDSGYYNPGGPACETVEG